jgi:uncharacterized repeat protein (TIGR03987 family)
MSPLLRVALGFTGGACVCYAVSIWSGLLSGQLRGWHVVVLWMGLGCDVGGTGLMTVLAGKLDLNLHGIAGYLGIAGMMVLAIWATRLYRASPAQRLKAFHWGSTLVWLLWMVPLVNGVFSMMGR